MARRAGADDAEVYLESSRELEVKVLGGRLERTTEAVDAGCGLRVGKGGRPGFASTTRTFFPSLASKYAVVRPAIPAPTTQTS